MTSQNSATRYVAAASGTAAEHLDSWANEADAKHAAPTRPYGANDDSVQMYLREIGKVALLSAEEEVRLAELIERGRAAAIELYERQDLAQVESLALERSVAHGEDARRQLIQANLRLVVSIAKKYINGPLSLMDLVQEGNIGLMRAVEKFDYTRGHRFSTYATWWIRQSITRAIAEQSRLIRLPVHLVDTISLMRRAARRLEQALGREPTSQELADALDISERKVRSLLQAMAQPLSLEQPLGAEGDGNVGEMVATEDDDAPLTIATQRMLERDLAEALAKLSERERAVLQMRYGLMDGRRRTLEEVGVAFGITRERTRQIEADALRHLRAPLIGLRLQSYLE
jgi:RNA polymerase primary sigma factor